MDFTIDQTLRRELEPGERLLWSGRPLQGIRFRRSDLGVVGIGIAWCAMGLITFLTGRGSIEQAKSDPFFLFIAIGLVYMFSVRFVVDAIARRKIFYGVTDRRAIIIAGVFAQSATSLDYKSMSEITLCERSNGRGDIVFGKPSPLFVGRGHRPAPSFDLLADARKAHAILRTAQAAARK